MPTSPQKIAVLGGGVGAMSTVYNLTNEPGWQGRYDITVYQMGWRLGGKGASGRGEKGRIEEHGLHVWLGFYNNAFDMIRKVYAELGRPPGTPLAEWTDAFKEHEYIVLAQEFQGEWVGWDLNFPTNDAVPGTGGELPTLWDYIEMTLEWLHELFNGSILKNHPEAFRDTHEHRSVLQWIRDHLRMDLKTTAFTYETMAEELLVMVNAHVDRIGDDPKGHTAADHSLIVHLLESLLSWLRRELLHLIESNVELLRLFILIDFGATGIIGLLKDGVLFHPDELDSLDGEDFRDWMKRHGAAPETYNSPVTQGWYDLVFAYHNGDVAQPASAAGTTIRCIFRTFLTYKGAIFWKMQAGMGDTIFAPIYSVLKERGVKFRFFHRVKNLGLSDDRRSIERIEIARQATEKDPAGYNPLVPIKDLDCWPSSPDYDQLEEGEELKSEGVNLESFYTTWKDPEELTLRRGVDFDQVVFGISLGSVPWICTELIEANPDWKRMVEQVETVRTMAYQVWLNRDLTGLGWDQPSPVMDAYVDPMNTWADMSQLIPREDWGEECRNISYFCGPMVGDTPPPDRSKTPEEALEEVRTEAWNWLDRLSPPYWPAASVGGVFDRSILLDIFYRANIDPSERYVLSVPGSTAARIHPADTGFGNLTIAGDWTVNELNAGCVEAAVTSGILAADAVARSVI